MAARHNPPPLRTKGGAWGAQRVKLGISIRDLERRSGVSRAVLSYAESGRMVPRGDEYDAVMKVLLEEEQKQGGSIATQ